MIADHGAVVMHEVLDKAIQIHGSLGRIVTVGSLYSRFGVAHTAAYTSSKHAVLGLTRVLSAEGVKYGITANCILPGWVDTEMVRGEAQKVSDARGTPPEDVIKK